MNPVLSDFILDLNMLKSMVDMSGLFSSFPAFDLEDDAIQEVALREAVTELHLLASKNHLNMPILNGVLLLYLAGRFENFVRELFEDLCDSLASQVEEFSHLPKKMQDNLIQYTGNVIANPRKYGIADNEVVAFVTALSDNLSGTKLSGVNSKCLSLTTENMWPDTVKSIFSRIGATGVWERIGQQAGIQTFFEVDSPKRASDQARKVLSDLMTLRNRIAHPSGAITWPSADETYSYLKYCQLTATALSEICEVWSNSLGTRTEGN